MRARLLLLGILWPWLWLSATPARADWQVGGSVFAGFTSQVVAPGAVTPTTLTREPAPSLSGSAFVFYSGAWRRVVMQLRLQGDADGFLLVRPVRPLLAYRAMLTASAEAELTGTTNWNFTLSALQSSFNGLGPTGDPTPLSPLNLRANAYLGINAQSSFQIRPTGRWQVNQTLGFRSFLPLSLLGGGAAVPLSAVTSYSLDAQAAATYQWPSATVGGDVGASWFVAAAPSGATSLAQRSIIPIRFGARASYDLTPRLGARASAGVLFASPAERFFARDATLVSVVGGLELRYVFVSRDIELAGGYDHAVGGEVAIGRFSQSDTAYVRATVPLRAGLDLTGSASYRYSRGTRLTPGPSFHLLLLDATLRWQARDYLAVFGRYQYVIQRSVGTAAPGDITVLDLDRHVVLVGVTFSYPPR